MKLMIFNLSTDENNTILSFTTEWIDALSKNFEEIYVITMQEGKHNFNEKVKVFEIKKGNLRIIRFYRVIINILLKNKIGACFAHMTPLQHNLAYPLLFLFNIKTLLWYEHGKITNTLRIARKLCNRSISASPSKLSSRRKNFVTGHGINTKLFYPKPWKSNKKEFQIKYVGRISKIKRIDIILKIMKELNSLNGINFSLKIIGDVINNSSRDYYNSLNNYINSHNIGNKIVFSKGLNRMELNKEFNQADLIVSTSETNSLDKVLLEAMACETLILTNNPSFSSILRPKLVSDCYCESKEVEELKSIILKFAYMPTNHRENICKELRKIILKDHSLEKTISKISSHLYEISSYSSKVIS